MLAVFNWFIGDDWVCITQSVRNDYVAVGEVVASGFAADRGLATAIMIVAFKLVACVASFSAG